MMRHLLSLGAVLSIGLAPFAHAGSQPPDCVTGSDDSAAVYRVTFETSFGAEGSGDPFGIHFTFLQAAVHDPCVSFWELGGQATLGIKRMAEFGATSPWSSEVGAAIDAGSARAYYKGDEIPLSPGATSLDITLSERFSCATLVSMFAPSDDWFLGVSGINLRKDGAWLEEVIAPLVLHDAGTRLDGVDTGDPITLNLSSYFVLDGMSRPLGTMRFELVETSEAEDRVLAPHDGDLDENGRFSLGEMLRLVQLFNLGTYHCAAESEDGYAPGYADLNCTPHHADFAPADWRLSLAELLRAIQLYNAGGHDACDSGDDGFCPATPPARVAALAL